MDPSLVVWSLVGARRRGDDHGSRADSRTTTFMLLAAWTARAHFKGQQHQQAVPTQSHLSRWRKKVWSDGWRVGPLFLADG